jgi:site-specific DNA-methyltransferase (adenine-specific)
LYNGDCIEILKTIKPNSIDLIFADPPYFLSNGGKSIRSGKVVSVNKGSWDDKTMYDNHLDFTKEWIRLSYNVLKDGGSIWVSGTIHNIFDIKNYLDLTGFKTINIVVWHKSDPPPLIYKNKLKFSYELIIWASKGVRHTFNYDEMFRINNEELQDVWTIPAVQMHEKKYGYHPTQKPEALLERIIKASSMPNDIVLDPFCGSGTTCYVAKKLKRRFIGIEKEKEYFNISRRRIDSI